MASQSFSSWVVVLVAVAACSAGQPSDDRAKEKAAAEFNRLVKDLGSTNAPTRANAAVRLAKKGKAAVPYLPLLLDAFTDPQLRSVRQALAEGFAAMGSEAKPAVRPLLDVLDEVGNAGLRQSAVNALGHIKSDADKVVPALLKTLDDPNRNVCVTTLWALGNYGPDAKAAVPILLKRLKREKADSDLRFPTIGALARVGRGDPRAARAVVPLLEKEKDKVFVLESIGRLGPAGKDAIPQLVACVKMKDAGGRTIQARAMAAWALGQMGEEIKQPVVDLLTQALLDKKNGLAVRENAARALKDLGPKIGESAIPALIQIVRDRDRPHVQAHEALIAMGQKAVPGLVNVLKDSQNPSVKERSLRLLEAIGPAAKEATPAIEQELKNPDSNVSFWARRALDSIQGKKKTK